MNIYILVDYFEPLKVLFDLILFSMKKWTFEKEMYI